MSDSPAFASAHRLRSARSRHREASHEEAHDGDAPGRGKIPDHPLIPKTKPKLVEDDAALAKLIADLRKPGDDGAPPAFAYDSEFIGESTYHPRLCLIQVATTTRVALIDPLAEIDLGPFWELIADAGVRKVVHAGEQDLEPVVRLGGAEPKNVFDTQVAAGFCGLPYPASLAKLVEHFVGVRLGKGLTFTQWDQRPLSGKQLAYAADDVRFLPAAVAALDAALGEGERRRWAAEECDRRGTGQYLGADDEPWERVRGGNLGGPAGGIVRELAVWRDAAAKAADLPPRALVKDEVLVSIARRPPKEADKLAALRHMPRPVVEQFGDDILAAVERGKTAKLPRRPPPPSELSLGERFVGDSVFALLQTLAAAQGLDATLLANRRDAEAFARAAVAGEPVDGHPLMRGWRREAVGGRLLDLLRNGGSAAVCWSDGRLRLLDA